MPSPCAMLIVCGSVSMKRPWLSQNLFRSRRCTSFLATWPMYAASNVASVLSAVIWVALVFRTMSPS